MEEPGTSTTQIAKRGVRLQGHLVLSPVTGSAYLGYHWLAVPPYLSECASGVLRFTVGGKSDRDEEEGLESRRAVQQLAFHSTAL